MILIFLTVSGPGVGGGWGIEALKDERIPIMNLPAFRMLSQVASLFPLAVRNERNVKYMITMLIVNRTLRKEMVSDPSSRVTENTKEKTTGTRKAR